MAKTLNFNTINPPTLPLVMSDPDQTQITVTTPTEGMVEELQEMAPALDKVVKANDAESIKAVYTLAAKLMSCNREGLQVTVDDLRGKYRLGLETLIVFFNAYLDFLDEFKNAKN